MLVKQKDVGYLENGQCRGSLAVPENLCKALQSAWQAVCSLGVHFLAPSEVELCFGHGDLNRLLVQINPASMRLNICQLKEPRISCENTRDSAYFAWDSTSKIIS
jgi:hypothetical protein